MDQLFAAPLFVLRMLRQTKIKDISVTYLLTAWSRVLLEKLTVSASSQEISRIFGTRRFLGKIILIS
jgi:hypothetical protein